MPTAFSNKIKEFCKAVGTNKKALADSLGITPGLLNSWMQTDPPNNQNVKLIIAGLVELDAIVTFEQAQELFNVAYHSDSVTYKFTEDEQQEDWYKELLAKTSGDVEYFLKYASINATTKKKRFTLPKPLSTVIGREREVTQLKELLTLPDVRLITIKAIGGMGKTSLGLQVVNELQNEAQQPFTHGLLFVPLLNVTSASLMIAALLQALELKPPASGNDTTPGKVLLNFLSNKRMLIMLDNFEQLVAASRATSSNQSDNFGFITPTPGSLGSGDLDLEENPRLFLNHLLKAAPEVKLIVTSQERIRLYGEQVIELKPLTFPPLNKLPDTVGEADVTSLVGEYTGLALFSKIAIQNDSDFKITTQNVKDVCAICAYLDGLPLGIELAAARINQFKPSQMLHYIKATPPVTADAGNVINPTPASQPNDNTRLLELAAMGAQGLPERHRSLENTFSLSYGLLSRAEQAILRRLSIFEGGCSLEALSEVCLFGTELEQITPREMEQIVSVLVDKSLVHPATSEQPGLIITEPRFDMLETTRSYCIYLLGKSGTQIEANEIAELRERYTKYFLNLAWQAENYITGIQKQEWQDRLSLDYLNLMKTLRIFVGQTELNKATDLVAILGYLWINLGSKSYSFKEGRTWLNHILNLANPKTPVTPVIRAKALHHAGRLAILEKDWANAKLLLNEAIPLWRKAKENKWLALSLLNLGNIYYSGSEPNHAEASKLYAEAEIIAAKMKDKHLVSVCSQNLANIHLTAREFNAAKAKYEQALQLKLELNNLPNVAIILKNLAILAIKEQNLDKAELYSKESLAINNKLVNPNGNIENLLNLARVAHLRKSYLQAKKYYIDGLSLAIELTNFTCLPFAIIHIASLFIECKTTEVFLQLVKYYGAVEEWTKPDHTLIDSDDRSHYNAGASSIKNQIDSQIFERQQLAGILLAADKRQVALEVLSLLQQTFEAS